MADMQFDLVSPERSLASATVSEVQIPGADGDMTAMADHAPTITTLRPGMLRAVGSQGASEFFVTGGFAEITGTGTTVLAERAYAKDSPEAKTALQGHVEEARATAQAAEGDAKDVAEKALADLEQLLSDMV